MCVCVYIYIYIYIYIYLYLYLVCLRRFELGWARLFKKRGHAPVVRLLLEAGAQSDARDVAGKTALMMTADPDVRRLLEAPATT